jgi:hypothetical protein
LFFDRAWDQITVELDGDGWTQLPLSDSFWRTCSELRSAEIGRWLLRRRLAPWPKGRPPLVVLDHVSGNRFKARLA